MAAVEFSPVTGIETDITIKQTDRLQIDAWGNDARTAFDAIEVALSNLVEQTATVPWKGERARQVITKLTSNAVEFSGYMVDNMTQMALVVSENTSFVATALGGAAINLDPPTKKVDMPTIDNDVSVESAAQGPLSELSTQAETIYRQIYDLFVQAHSGFNALGGSGWLGPEYNETNSSLTLLTNNTIEGINNSYTVMTTEISNQLGDLNMAV